MKQTVCDHCGKVINNDTFKDIPISVDGYKEHADLCGVCIGQLINFVEAYIDGEGEK